jgi:hypothetical protein
MVYFFKENLTVNDLFVYLRTKKMLIVM